ncbi:DNA-binding protein [Trichodelitschia bisporula]|uniref:DNA-binding protein n=1 Tax=Trichodelitschia bisporula TaxID=703511 RepID=A0A6G1HYC6_9PEZI|nr:DNA-binding protein [Trichodelitschia bisporula]
MAGQQAVKSRVKPQKQATTKAATEAAIKAASTEAAQLISRRQSLEIAQTLIHGSISCLAYLRSLFPEKCFDDHVYDTKGEHQTYQQYANGGTGDQPRRGGTRFKALRRGRSKPVDVFLDLLEKGAFEALGRGVLRAIQLNISEKADNPSQVVESYTFTFRYEQTAARGTLGDVTMQGPVGPGVTVKNVKYALQMFIRRIITLCQTLPDLPMKRYLTVQLYYTDECDRFYEPPGFQPCSDTRLWFAAHPDWKKNTQDCGTIDAGFHAVALKVSHLQPLLDSSAKSEAESLPSGMDYKDAGSGQDDVDMGFADPPVPEDNAEGDAMNVDMIQDHAEKAATSLFASSPPREAGPSQVSTQTRNDLHMRDALRSMLMPSSQSANQEETQPVEHISSKAEPEPKLTFSQKTLASLSKTRRRTGHAKANRMMNSNGKDVVSCECGFNDEEEGMVNCDFCGRWQHLCCYGYEGTDDPRIPAVHICYKCLLGESEASLLRELEHFILLRKGVHVIMEWGYNNDREFSEALHCDIQTASGVAKHLRQEGFLVCTPGSKKRGFSQSGKPRFCAVSKSSDYERMLKRYFDPTYKIAHHLDLPASVVRDNTTALDYPLPLMSSRRSDSLRKTPETYASAAADDFGSSTGRYTDPGDPSSRVGEGSAGKRNWDEEETISPEQEGNARKKLRASRAARGIDVGYQSASPEL